MDALSVQPDWDRVLAAAVLLSEDAHSHTHTSSDLAARATSALSFWANVRCNDDLIDHRVLLREGAPLNTPLEISCPYNTSTHTDAQLRAAESDHTHTHTHAHSAAAGDASSSGLANASARSGCGFPCPLRCELLDAGSSHTSACLRVRYDRPDHDAAHTHTHTHTHTHSQLHAHSVVFVAPRLVRTPAPPVADVTEISVPAGASAASKARTKSSNRGRIPPARVVALALDRTCTRIAAGCANGELVIQRLATAAAPVPCVGHVADVNALQWFPSDAVLASASVDLSIRIWEAATGRCAAVLRGHTSAVTGLGIIDRGRNIVSTSMDGTLKLWHVGTAKTLATISVGARANAMALWDAVPSPAEATVAEAGVETGEFGTKGKFAAVAREDACCAIVNIRNREKILSLPLLSGDSVKPDSSYTSGHRVLCVDATDSGVIALGGTDGMLSIWDARNVITGGSPAVIWSGVVTSTHADVCCVRLLYRAPVEDKVFVLVGTSDGAAGIIAIQAAAATLVVMLTGADGDAVRCADMKWEAGMASSEATSDSARTDSRATATVALGCNDGRLRIYSVPAEVLTIITNGDGRR